jgi:hypothetical protein
MAAVEEDYFIAETTLEDDTIVFQIDIKVDQSFIRFARNQEDEEEPHEAFADETEEIEQAHEVYNSAEREAEELDRPAPDIH